MYYEYWDLRKAPFDNVPDPSMYADCHTTMENAIAESLFAIEEGGDCIAVIVGDVGLGKTMSIRMIIDSLDQKKHKIALVTNPSTTFVQILREIIGQLTGKPCEEKKKVDLLEIFNNLLFKTSDEGKSILIFIDEANAISASNLESLRLLTNMQADQSNLFTIVLVGQMELAQRLEHPKRANLFQRVGTYCRIEKIQSEVLTRAYVETRLKLAGSTKKIFTDDALHYLWKYSEHGVPRLINKICKLSLKAGETNEFSEINGDVICQIGERFQKMSGPAKQMRMPRKRPKSQMLPDAVEETELVPEKVSAYQESEVVGPTVKEDVSLKSPVHFDSNEEIATEETGQIAEGQMDIDTSILVTGNEDKEEMTTEHGPKPDMVPAMENEHSQNVLTQFQEEELLTQVQESETDNDMETETTGLISEHSNLQEQQLTFDDYVSTNDTEDAEMEIGDCKVRVNLPSDIVREARSSDNEHCQELAGVMAAQTIRENPQLMQSPTNDPVPIWNDIKNFIFGTIKPKKSIV